jgi:putative ABC transport system permease protein
MLSGLPQAWPRAQISPITGLSGNSRVTEGIDRHWLRDGFVVIQVAMAVILMMGSGLLVRSFLQLRRTDPGFDARGVLVAPVFLDTQAYNSGEKTRAYYRTLFEKLSTLPGVTAVGGATTLPTSPLGPDFERPVWPEESAGDTSSRVPASVRMVTTDYFNVLGFRITNGRAFDRRDTPESPRVLMVSETLARRVWPGQTAVGKRLVVDYSTAGTYPYEVIGIVGDVRFHGPRSEPLAEIYLPHAQRSYLVLNVAVKTSGDARALIPLVREALKSIDPQKPAQGLYRLEDLVGATYARDRQAMVTLLVFASAATFLAVLSVYGVLSQRVRERSRDIGIRLAIGANPASVVMWVAGSGLRLIGVGILSGVILARILGSSLDGLLFGVSSHDALTMLVVMTIVACTGMIAMLVPSWRATRIDPVHVLRRG